MEINVREHIDVELKKLEEKLLKLGKLAVDAISQAVTALKEQDVAKAREVIKGDNLLDELAEDIDMSCLRFMARFQPLGQDLRTVSAIMHMAVDLERIGDYGSSIAKRAIRLSDRPHIKPLLDIPRMENDIRKMVDKALEALMERDVKKAEEVCRMDDEVDDLDQQIFRELLLIMIERPNVIEQATELLLISRTLERAGDHATNLAERVIYMVTGKKVSASQIRRPKGEVI
ncbi:MAG TPA: phosphate signaling complex protein PhoU [Acetomicrobium flavidum]|uniref:Phosphate-specific transport system accessory protein PhoU n=2 Tax=Acetomicrobium TaxID=49894 RepID=I4BTS8_ACEMN|nr:phosphate signaling complex protein PhoU [Acetomicrobium mobile]NLG95100.1 phosphate signaling complex protein PhoU [Acetomicrobium flavidum]AFM20685.1 phosphate transport system regulatory protein PhoU [Acetomicrobium mobile DSM 13181]SIN67844.1 phosphate transport system protein [Acetomicrobium flavidum]HOJ82140.1 phosphate signaling complex protein PhoU [Acetomicrobium flavidum]HOM31108.1 phosphate signaling complex protein PhoU [Acetomicrobium flavidum]